MPDGLTATSVALGFLHGESRPAGTHAALRPHERRGCGEVNIKHRPHLPPPAACAITTPGGGVVCWGSGARATPAELTSGVTGIAVGQEHTCGITAAGNVTCYGNCEFGQCNVPSGMGPVVALSAGGHTTCALTAAAGVHCWGPQGSFVIPGDAADGYVAVAVAQGHSNDPSHM